MFTCYVHLLSRNPKGDVMGFRSSLVRGSAIILVSTIVETSLSLVRNIVVARLLADPDLLGILSILASLRGVFLAVALLGIPTALARFFAQFIGGEERESVRLIQTGFVLSTLLSLVSGAIMFAASWFLAIEVYHRHELIPLIQVGAFSVTALAFRNILGGALRGLRRMSSLAILIIIENSLLLGASYVFVSWYGVIGAAYAVLAESLVALIVALRFLFRDPRARTFIFLKRPDQRAVLKMLKYTLPIFASGFVVLPAALSVQTFLAIRVSFSELGLYEIGYGFYSLLIAIPATLAVPLMPMVAQIKQRSPDRVNVIFAQALRLMILVAIPLTIATSLSSRFLLQLLYGDAYTSADKLTSILVLTAVFLGVVPVTTSFLLASGRSLAVLSLDLVWAAVFVSASYILIDRIGFLGIGYAHLGAGISLFVVQLLNFRRWFAASLGPVRVPVSFSLLSTGLTLVLLQLFTSEQTLLLAVPVAGSLGVLSLLLMTPNERLILTSSIREVLKRH